jgi:two-component system cell cycle sensor histidine kinase/response regulator CckA
MMPRSTPPMRGKGTVLLVDDEPVVLDVGRQMLEMAGFHVVTARNGYQAYDVLAEKRDSIDCVLLDMTMPGASCEVTLERLQSVRENVPVILSSGYSEEVVRSRIGTRELAAFIQKPYLYETLRDVMDHVLEEPERQLEEA